MEQLTTPTLAFLILTLIGSSVNAYYFYDDCCPPRLVVDVERDISERSQELYGHCCSLVQCSDSLACCPNEYYRKICVDPNACTQDAPCATDDLSYGTRRIYPGSRSAWIMTPRFGKYFKYPSNSADHWVVSLNGPGYKFTSVTITLIYFAVEFSYNDDKDVDAHGYCVYDYLLVDNTKYCGFFRPYDNNMITQSVSGKVLHLGFHSDSIIEFGGFLIELTFHEGGSVY